VDEKQYCTVMRGNAHAGRSLLLTVGLNGGILWTVLIAVTRAFWYCLRATRLYTYLYRTDKVQTTRQQEIADNGEIATLGAPFAANMALQQQQNRCNISDHGACVTSAVAL
jgi:hypothetical protein